MIRPVLYVDLPGIIYAIDHRARSKQHELANFVCWLEPVENVLPPPPILRKFFHCIPLPVHGFAKITGIFWALLRYVSVLLILPGISLTWLQWPITICPMKRF